MKLGLQPVVIKAMHRLAYYEALDKAHTQGQLDDFLQLVVDVEQEAIEGILTLVG